MTTNTMLDKSTIVKYWYNYGNEVYAQDHEAFAKLPQFVQRLCTDVGEPFCWGCHRYDTAWDCPPVPEPPKGKKNSNRKIMSWYFRNWDRLPLERCHIIPRARVGTYDPSNIVLMCETCHQEGPTVTDRQFMLNWMDHRRQQVVNRTIQEWTDACLPLGANPTPVLLKYILIKTFCQNQYVTQSSNISTTHGLKIYPLASEAYSVLHFPIATVRQAIESSGRESIVGALAMLDEVIAGLPAEVING